MNAHAVRESSARRAAAANRRAGADSAGEAPARFRSLPAWALWLAAAAVFVAISRRLYPFLVDDVFISLRYGRHLLAGAGLVYNLGERVEGYTNFLWTLFAAPSVVAPFGILLYLRLLNGAFALLASWQAGELAARVARAGGPDAGDAGARLSPGWVALGGAMFLLTPAVSVSAAEGLETMLFTLLLAAAANRLLADRDGARVPAAGLLLAALAMTRPDGILCAAWGIAAAWWLGRPRAYVVRLALAALGLWAVYWAARWAWYGQPFPNTFYAKGTGGAMLFARGAAELGRFTEQVGGPVLVLALLPLVRRGRRVAIALLAGIAVRVAFQLWSGGPTMERFRFLVPVTPLLDALLLAGAAAWARAPRTRLVLACAAGALALVPGWLAYPAAERDALGYAAGLQQAHWRLGQDVLAHSTRDAVIAIDDAGLVPLEGDRTNIDMLGLNDRHMAHVAGAYTFKVDVPYVLGRSPDLVVLIGRVPRPVRDEDFWLAPHAAMFRDPAFRAAYGYSRRYAFNPGYHLLVFRRHGSARASAAFWGGEGTADPAE
jgi:arabinofuranosyltransferase